MTKLHERDKIKLYNEKFLANVELTDIVVIESKSKLFNIFEKEKDKIEMSIHLTPFSVKLFSNGFSVEISFKLDGGCQEKKLVKLHARVSAIYSYTKPDEVNSKLYKEFVRIYCKSSALTNIVGFFRKYSLDIITAHGYPRFILPLIKFSN